MRSVKGAILGENAPERENDPGCQSEFGEGGALGKALFRVTRATMFANQPIPELEALPLAQLRLLWSVRHAPDATMKDYSERLNVSQSTVTQLADRLVRRGLVERQPDAEDRRVVRLALSPHARTLMMRGEKQHDRVLKAIWDALTIEERETILQALDVLGRIAEEVRAAEGVHLPPLPKWTPLEEEGKPSDSGASQPVFDLMARRVRGQQHS